MYEPKIYIDHPIRDAFRKVREGVIEFFGLQEYARKGYFGKYEQQCYSARSAVKEIVYARMDIRTRMAELEDRIQAEQEEDQRFWQGMDEMQERIDRVDAQIKAIGDHLRRN